MSGPATERGFPSGRAGMSAGARAAVRLFLRAVRDDEERHVKGVLAAPGPSSRRASATSAALDAVAAAMRSIVTEPMVKGEVSTGLTPLMAEPYRRFCQPCNAIHLYEMPIRLAALRAGLELQAGTSPPVFQPIRGRPGPASTVPDEFDVIRGKTHSAVPCRRLT